MADGKCEGTEPVGASPVSKACFLLIVLLVIVIVIVPASACIVSVVRLWRQREGPIP
jgi:hypothetical protein